MGRSSWSGGLHAEISTGAPSAAKISQVLTEIDPLNDKLTKVEDDFSYTLGAGSRWLANLILTLLFSIVLTVEISGLTLTIFVSRGISKGLNEIIRSAEQIAMGDHSSRARAYSRDEIGILANSFNEMTQKLEQNITALKDSEEALQRSTEVAEQSLIIKEHFLANMSHEIRTPMNAIIGFTNLLEHSQLNEEQQQFVEAIRISGQNLTVIINDILDYSKIKSGMITLEQIPVDVRAILATIYTLNQPRAGEKNIDFEYYVNDTIPYTVIGDPIRLTQILSNLIDNALKFTEKGSVYVSVFPRNTTGDHITLEFEVTDTGKGIPREKQAIIFERFTQATEDTTRRYGGTGLGLSIVKSLVELYGGTISLKSEVDEGSTFSVIISFLKYDPDKAANHNTLVQSHETQGNKVRVLYAEDNPLNQKLVLHFSKNFGYDIEIAENGKVAVEKLRVQPFDLVLMDIQMPEMDGYEATRIIRGELNSAIPIIALTAHAMSGEKEKCLGLGMNDFVSKPFDPIELNAKIQALVMV